MAKNREPTPKQKKFIKLLLENLGKKNSTRTLESLMLEAGYSKKMSLNPYQILATKAVKEGTKDFVKSLDDKRRRAITYITEKKMKKAPARELAYVVDLFTKNHQLLTGGSTENKAIKVEGIIMVNPNENNISTNS